MAVETSALAVPIPVVPARVSANSGAPVFGSAASTANAAPLAGWPPTQPSGVSVNEVALSMVLTVPYEPPEVTLRPTSSAPVANFTPVAVSPVEV